MTSDPRLFYTVMVWETAHDNVTHWCHETPSGGCQLKAQPISQVRGIIFHEGKAPLSVHLCAPVEGIMGPGVKSAKQKWSPLLSLPVTHQRTLWVHRPVSEVLEALVPRDIIFARVPVKHKPQTFLGHFGLPVSRDQQ